MHGVKRSTNGFLFLAATALVWSALILTVAAPRPAGASGCASGSLIKGSLPAIYYCGADGKRYVFPNLKTYHTWYADFSGVSTISDASLSAVPLGGNVTYRPGVRLVKITTDPKVYAVDAGGALRWISSEAVARQLYGSAWNTMVDDVPDAFFVNYLIGADVSYATQFVPSSVTSTASSINVDKRLGQNVPHTDNGTISLSLSPYATTLASGQSTTVSASANDPDGVSMIYIYVNGSVAQTCPQSGSNANASCSVVLYGSNYSAGSNLSIYGRVQDREGSGVNSATRSLAIGSSGSSSNGSVSLALSPYATTLAAGQSTTASVSAYDPDGISTVYIYVNGSIVQTCAQSGSNANATCSATIYGSNYSNGTTLSVYGQMTDRNGLTANSSTSSLTIGSGSSDGWVSVSLAPYASTLTTAQTTTATVTGYDTHGISTVYVLVNGSIVQTCPQSGSSANASCSATISGSLYYAGSSVSVAGRIVDVNSNQINSTATTLAITGTSSGSSANGSVSLSLSPYATTLASNQSTTVSVSAYDPDGISMVYIYVNGSVAQTCPQSGSAVNATCSATLYGSNYSQGSTVSIYAQEFDHNNASLNSATQSLTIGSGSGSTGNGQVTISLAPYATTLAAGQSTTVSVSAYDPDGVSRVSVYVNGSILQTCNAPGTSAGATCAATIYASNYTSGTTLSIYGQLADRFGATANSATQSLAIGSGSGSTGNATVSISLSPYATTLASNQSTTVSVSAYDPDGISMVYIYVNGSVAQTCPQAGTSANAACTVVLYGTNYTAGSTLSIYGRVQDRNGATANSATQSLAIGTSGTGSSAGATTSIYLTPSVTTLAAGQSLVVTVNAYDPAGLAYVDIYVNGSRLSSCPQPSTWPLGASCSATVARSSFTQTTSLSIYGQGVNRNTGTTNSETKTITLY